METVSRVIRDPAEARIRHPNGWTIWNWPGGRRQGHAALGSDPVASVSHRDGVAACSFCEALAEVPLYFNVEKRWWTVEAAPSHWGG